MEALKPNAPSAPWNGPIQLAVNFGYETRNVLKDREPKITKPDTDNLMKTLKDCMTACGFWWDDAQVAEEFASKFWTIQPHITIVVSKKDCMTACGFWWDDAQVAEEFASKFWTIQPHITIVVSKMEQ